MENRRKSNATKKVWRSENGKTTIVAMRTEWPEGEGHHMVIDITHNYGDYTFNGETRNNTGHHRLYSKSTNLSYGLKRGKEYFSNSF